MVVCKGNEVPRALIGGLPDQGGTCTQYRFCGRQKVCASVLHTVLAGGQHGQVGLGDSVLEFGVGDGGPEVSIQSSYYHHHPMLYPCSVVEGYSGRSIVCHHHALCFILLIL